MISIKSSDGKKMMYGEGVTAALVPNINLSRDRLGGKNNFEIQHVKPPLYSLY